MANTRQNDRREGSRRESIRRKGDIRVIEVRGKEDKEQEVNVRHETPPKRKQAQCGAGMKNLQPSGARLL
jgi:hypothetical protein